MIEVDNLKAHLSTKEFEEVICKDMAEVKINPLLLAEVYLKYFNQFKQLFEDLDEAKELLDKHEIIAKRLLELYTHTKRPSIFLKRKHDVIIDFVLEDYAVILSFVELCHEVAQG